jgi:hypothetical protein
VSAKHKRPFYIFAAVAVICGMVLFTGIRSKAEDSHAPVLAGSQVADGGTTISPLTDEPETTSPSSEPGATGGDATGAEGDFDPTLPDLDGSLTAPGGGDAQDGSHSGVTVLPPFVDPVEDGTVPPVTDDESDGKGRGHRGGKKDKDNDKDKDEHGNQPDDEAVADAESDDEVDPDVFGVDEDEVEGQGEELDDPTGDATP